MYVATLSLQERFLTPRYHFYKQLAKEQASRNHKNQNAKTLLNPQELPLLQEPAEPTCWALATVKVRRVCLKLSGVREAQARNLLALAPTASSALFGSNGKSTVFQEVKAQRSNHIDEIRDPRPRCLAKKRQLVPGGEFVPMQGTPDARRDSHPAAKHAAWADRSNKSVLGGSYKQTSPWKTICGWTQSCTTEETLE